MLAAGLFPKGMHASQDTSKIFYGAPAWILVNY